MYQLYKPNSKNTGFAFTFNMGLSKFNPKNNLDKAEKALWISAIAQSGWDDKNKKGHFRKNIGVEEKNVSTKITIHEIGGLLKTIRSGTPFSAYHSNNKGNTQITFSKHYPKIKNRQTGQWEKSSEPKGFFLNITKNSEQQTSSFGIPFTFGEAETFSRFLIKILDIHFLGMIKANEENIKKNLKKYNNFSNNDDFEENHKEEEQEEQEEEFESNDQESEENPFLASDNDYDDDETPF